MGAVNAADGNSQATAKSEHRRIGMRILIVDDDLTRTSAITEALRKRFGREPEVWMAQSAEEAVNILRHNRLKKWDIVFLDHDLLNSVWMPPYGGKDGRTVARAIKTLDIMTDTVVVQSVNQWGSREIKSILKGRRVFQAPFPDCLPLIANSKWKKVA
jgi:CheY-like chemotaxis protein